MRAIRVSNGENLPPTTVCTFLGVSGTYFLKNIFGRVSAPTGPEESGSYPARAQPMPHRRLHPAYRPREDFLGTRVAWVGLCRVGAPVFCFGLLCSAAFFAHIFSSSRMFLVFIGIHHPTFRPFKATSMNLTGYDRASLVLLFSVPLCLRGGFLAGRYAICLTNPATRRTHPGRGPGPSPRRATR
jgi:hypothetical protein